MIYSIIIHNKNLIGLKLESKCIFRLDSKSIMFFMDQCHIYVYIKDRERIERDNLKEIPNIKYKQYCKVIKHREYGIADLYMT